MSFANGKFGRLTVIKEVRPDIYLCKCLCGNKVEYWRSQLACDVKRHCGCLNNRWQNAHPGHGHIRRYWTVDGESRQRTTGEYNSYKNAKERCTVKTRPEYQFYGGRGIHMCLRWLDPNGQGFRNFLADMGPRPRFKTLDRVDPQGHYEPTNCIWGTNDEQADHRRRAMWPDGNMPPIEEIEAMERRLTEELLSACSPDAEEVY